MKEPIATFTRDGMRREAYTPGEAVALRADGWQEATAADPAVDEAQTESESESDTSLDLDDAELEASE